MSSAKDTARLLNNNQQPNSLSLDTQVKNIPFCYFGTGVNIWWRLFYAILNFFCFGLVEAFTLLHSTDQCIKKMVIGGRKLKFDTSDPYAKIPILCILHNTINNFTFGIWKIIGMMDLFLYSELDKRIYWGDEVENNGGIVWFPNGDGKGQFKIITASAGLIPGIIIAVSRLVSGLLLGIGEPWILSYQYSKLFPNMQFGGKGQFATTDNQPNAQKPTTIGNDTLKLKFEASGLQILLKLWFGHLISILTLGLFMCCFHSWFYAFLNQYIRVDESEGSISDKVRLVSDENNQRISNNDSSYGSTITSYYESDLKV